MDILKQTVNTIKRYSMLSDGDCILIGISGGPDSVCLALILDKLKEDFNLSLHAVYINHGLRPDEVEYEKSFCKTLCNSLDIAFFSKSVDVTGYAEKKRLSHQEAARELRYEVYERLSREVAATKIALGHTADDQAETFLMRLLRGSGRIGLSGIPPVRGKFIRPLIEVERRDIEEFLAEHASRITHYASRSFMVDSSNLKTDYFRNWVRHEIIPELKNKNPALIRAVCRTADILREEDTYLEGIVTESLMKLISRKDDAAVELFLFPLENMQKPILRRVLRRAINEIRGLRGIDFIHIEDMINLIKNGKSGDRLYLPKGIRAIKEYSLLIITSKVPVRIAEYEIEPPCEITIRDADVAIKALFEKKSKDIGDGKSSVLLDAGSMNFPLKIRAKAAGDFFFPLGFGKKKKLQDFFVDEKIPRDKRGKIPVVLSGNDIVWVAGYRADERFKVTKRTEKFLRLIISKDKL